MLVVWHCSQVFRAVVVLDAVEVMDDPGPWEFPAINPLPYCVVLRAIEGTFALPWSADLLLDINVAILDVATALPSRIVLAKLITRSVTTRLTARRPIHDSFAAIRTFPRAPCIIANPHVFTATALCAFVTQTTVSIALALNMCSALFALNLYHALRLHHKVKAL